jgi:hypothetical protein
LQFQAAKGTNNEPREITIPGTTFPSSGDFTIRLYDGTSASSTALRATERLLVTSSAPPAYEVPGGSDDPPAGVTYGSAMEAEVGYLDELADKFCPSFYNKKDESPLPFVDWNTDGVSEMDDNWDGRCAFKTSTPLSASQPGDVFPQDKQTLKNALEDRLLTNPTTPRYDIVNILVVGSNVDHNVMTSRDVKGPIDTWVRGGGTLMVFGSTDQTVQWLEPILKASIDSSSGGISVPDRSHPILHTADDLDVDDYDTNGKAWDLKDQGGVSYANYFTPVVVNDAGLPTLAISNPGAIGKGTVILTTFLPYDLRGDADVGSDRTEGLRLMNNLLMQGYRDLFLDYGPIIPESGHDVIPAVRKAQICYPAFTPAWDGTGDCPVTSRVPLDVIVYVF